MAEQTVELAPGESKQVSFEATPNEAKTYLVSVNGLSGSFTASAAPQKIIEFPAIDIFSLNGIPFSEVGSGEIPGVPGVSGVWARLRDTIVADRLPGAVAIRGRNKSISFVSDAGPNALYANLWYTRDWVAWGPGFKGNAAIPWKTGPEPYYKVAYPPFDFQMTPGNVITQGSWGPMVYSARILVEAVTMPDNAPYARAMFYVLDFLQCTGSGSA